MNFDLHFFDNHDTTFFIHCTSTNHYLIFASSLLKIPNFLVRISNNFGRHFVRFQVNKFHFSYRLFNEEQRGTCASSLENFHDPSPYFLLDNKIKKIHKAQREQFISGGMWRVNCWLKVNWIGPVL